MHRTRLGDEAGALGEAGPADPRQRNLQVPLVSRLHHHEPEVLLFIGFWALQGPEYYYL